MRRHGLVLIVIATLALSGCLVAPPSSTRGERPGPSSEASLDAAPADPGKAPVVQPPSLPAEAEQATSEGAAAFVRHWLALVSHAHATGDTEPMAELSHPECVACSTIRELVDELYAAGMSMRGSEMTVRKAVTTPVDDTGTCTIKLLVVEGPSEVVDHDGTVLSESDGSPPLNLDMQARFADGRWTLVTFSSL